MESALSTTTITMDVSRGTIFIAGIGRNLQNYDVGKKHRMKRSQNVFRTKVFKKMQKRARASFSDSAAALFIAERQG
ncbi:hypothetical protein ACFSO0_02795 [Brevibacillus sp. GCM10020057]|uniref:hypothetical protein n=1 Tax=Brevibacillus sp. GCM10020057 TaxID=3317327 RepID=UPI003633A0F6